MTEETTDIVPAEKSDIVAAMPPLPILANTTVLMKGPEDIEEAQAGLLAWVSHQLNGLQKEKDIAVENLEKATKMKVATAGWKRQVKLWDGRIDYYSKIKSAIQAGYFIMPDLPGFTDLFAVRTTQKTVSESVSNTWGHGSNRLSDVPSKPLPEGAGRYINPQPNGETWVDDETYKDHSGNERTRTRYFLDATEIDEVIDFPIKAVRPQVLEEVDKALMGKIFDELGVIHPRAGSTRRRGTGADPIVVGRIVRRESGKEFGCSFIIHWFVDTKDL